VVWSRTADALQTHREAAEFLVRMSSRPTTVDRWTAPATAATVAWSCAPSKPSASAAWASPTPPRSRRSPARPATLAPRRWQTVTVYAITSLTEPMGDPDDDPCGPGPADNRMPAASDGGLQVVRRGPRSSRRRPRGAAQRGGRWSCVLESRHRGLRADAQSGAPGKTTLPAIAACGASQSAVILDVGILVAAEDGVGEEPAGLRLGAVRIGEAVVLGQHAR
jgi:hypothetical protein